MKRIDGDYDNIRAAMDYSRSQEDSDSSLRFGSALMHFWYAKGYWGEGRDWLEEALRRSEGVRSHARARALWAAAVMAWDLDEYKRAEEHLAESLAILEEQGDDPEYSYEHALIVLGNVAAAQGDYEKARSTLEKARQLQVKLGDHWSLGWTLYYQADLEFDAGNLETARTMADASLANARAVGHRWAVARTINLIGILSAMAGDVENGLARAVESMGLQEVNGDRRGSGLSRLTIAYAQHLMGNYAAATDSAAECLRLFIDLSDRDGICLTLDSMGRSAMKLGYAGRAVRLYGAADAIRKSVGLARPEVYRKEIEADLAEARRSLGESEFERECDWVSGRPLQEQMQYALG
jgi:tetratricopeptide (TPR) repeat protein